MKRFILVLLLAGVFPAVSWADTLDFGSPSIQPAGASLSYAGGAAALIGSGIGINSISDITNSTPSNCTNCFLSFTTGASNGSWSWAAGGAGSITITGTDGVATGTLLSGQILSAQIVSCMGGSCIKVDTFLNSVNPALGTVLGYTPPSPNNWSGSSSLNIVLSGPTGAAFNLGRTQIGSGDLTTSPVKTREPSSLLMLGAGLVGLVGVRARRKLYVA